MRVTRYLGGAALAVLALIAQAQAPFQINGLHPDLVFTDAIVVVEELGGQCRIKHSRTEGGGVSAQCGMSRGNLSTSESESEPGQAAAAPAATPGPMIGAQPITRIGMEAAMPSAQLTRIVFVFDGSLEAVAQHLVQQYGPPDHDGAATAEESWSHAKRRSWSNGNYTLGLLNSPDLVILTVNRPPLETGAR
jgi:hypothetical protein